MTSRLREAINVLRESPIMVRGAIIALGVRGIPGATEAIDQAVKWQERVVHIAAVSDVDHCVILEEVKGFGLDQLDTIYRRICEGQEPHVVIADVRERWKKER